MNNIEHIGIAVKDLEKSNTLFASLFGKPHYKIQEVVSEDGFNVFCQFHEADFSLRTKVL